MDVEQVDDTTVLWIKRSHQSEEPNQGFRAEFQFTATQGRGKQAKWHYEEGQR